MTRRAGRPTMWALGRAGQAPTADVSVESEDAKPRVSIGSHTGWVYSTRLHPDPDKLERALQAFISMGGAGFRAP